MMKGHKAKLLALGAAGVLLAGCAGTKSPDPADPWESMNRATFTFNAAVDEFVTRPIAKGYIAVTPQPVRESVHNAFNNLGEPKNALNNALQGKGERTLRSVFRLLINTTLGLGGLFDVAGHFGGVAPAEEDFGQTLRVWGVPQGPYVVLPFLGPSTVTDATGAGVGVFTTPLYYWQNDPAAKYSVSAVNVLDMRATVMPQTDMLRDAIDPYAMARQAYLSMRRSAAYDGNPPLELTADEFEDEEEEAQDKGGSAANK